MSLSNYAAEPLEPRMLLAASLVQDLNKASSGSISMLGHLGNVAIFVESDGVHGGEPFRSDGTKAGTFLLRDIRVGSDGSIPEFLADIGNTMFFKALDGTTGFAPSLWKTDGTVAGTVKVANVNAEGSQVVVGKELFFFTIEAQGNRLWKTDGSRAGTVRLSGDLGGGGTAQDVIDDMAVFDGKVFFAGNDKAHGTELWRSDGTVAGTKLFADLVRGPTSANPSSFAATSGRVYFLDNIENSSKQHLWKTDGASVQLVETVGTRPPNGAFSIFQLTPIGDTLYFTEDERENLSHFFDSVWRTTGKSDTLLRLVRLRDPEILKMDANGPAPDRIYVQENLPDKSTQTVYSIKGDTVKAVADAEARSYFGLAQIGNDLYFRTVAADQSSVDVFRANADKGKVLLKHITGVADANQFSAVGSKIYFVTSSGTLGLPTSTSALWSTDGTAANTVQQASFLGASAFGIAAGGRLYFAAESGPFGYELWLTDGSPATTHLIRDIDPESDSSNPRMFTAGVGGTYFVADTGNNPPSRHGVYVYNESTRKVTGILGTGQNQIQFIGKLGGAEVIVTDNAVYRSDGTKAGTTKISNIDDSFLVSRNAAIAGGTLYFYDGGEIFKSNGTAKGTVKLASISFNSPGAALNNLLIFEGTHTDGESTTPALWSTDGTPGGTKIIANLFASKFFNFGGAVYFLADHSKTQDLWKTDGTAKGTKLIKAGLGTRNQVAVTPDSFYIYNGSDLWQSDGSASGSKLLKHFALNFGDDVSITAVGKRVYFPAYDSSHGYELWTSLGGRTVLLKDINPGVFGSVEMFPQDEGEPEDREVSVDTVAAPNGKMYFAADDGKHGFELWETDATPTGTKLVKDILPGVASSTPMHLAVTGNTLLFSAYDGFHGQEPWQLPLA